MDYAFHIGDVVKTPNGWPWIVTAQPDPEGCLYEVRTLNGRYARFESDEMELSERPKSLKSIEELSADLDRVGKPNSDGSYDAHFTKNEHAIITQVLVHIVAGGEWDVPETFHGGLGPDFCEACTALEKLGAYGGRTTDDIRSSMDLMRTLEDK